MRRPKVARSALATRIVSMYETFDQRRSRLLAAPLPEPVFITGKELLEEPTPPSSEDRLLELPADSWTPAVLLRQLESSFRKLFRKLVLASSSTRGVKRCRRSGAR
jgi:hypothetical protein